VSEEQQAVPREIRNATAVIYLEALGLLVASGILVSKTITGHPASMGRALLDAAFPLVGAVILVLCARGIGRLSPGARTPIVLIQLLALPVSFDLAFQAGLVAYGGPILIAALAVLYLLFTPAARAALDRVPD
jgi:hypothetical protein